MTALIKLQLILSKFDTFGEFIEHILKISNIFRSTERIPKHIRDAKCLNMQLEIMKGVDAKNQIVITLNDLILLVFVPTDTNHQIFSYNALKLNPTIGYTHKAYLEDVFDSINFTDESIYKELTWKNSQLSEEPTMMCTNNTNVAKD